MKDYGKALESFSQALLSPNPALQSRSHYNLGNTLYQRGEAQKKPEEKMQDWKNALQHYDQTLKLEPDDKEAKENRAFVEQKIEELKKQQEQKPTPTPTPSPSPSPSPQDKKDQKRKTNKRTKISKSRIRAAKEKKTRKRRTTRSRTKTPRTKSNRTRAKVPRRLPRPRHSRVVRRVHRRPPPRNPAPALPLLLANKARPRRVQVKTGKAPRRLRHRVKAKTNPAKAVRRPQARPLWGLPTRICRAK